MADESKYTGDESGELKFEFFDEGEDDSDKRFNSSVKNLLILIKDFYGADGTAVYWFNRNKQSFKLLAASEDARLGSYKERFQLGNDYVSSVCLEKKSDIINIESDSDKGLVGHFNGEFQVKSIIANPLLLNNEVIAVVLCESKTLNFFGKPNIYTLEVFSESITNYIKYYSLNEDFEFENKILAMLASGSLQNTEDSFNLIKTVFDRYIAYGNLYFVIRKGKDYTLARTYPEAELRKLDLMQDGLAFKAIEEKRILVHDFGKENNKEFRFSKDEKINTGHLFCSLPVVFDNECIGIAAFDALNNQQVQQKTLSKIYKLIYPVYLFLYLKSGGESALDYSGKLRGKDSFDSVLDSEINRCRLFNENDLYCAYFSVDSTDALADIGLKNGEVENLLIGFLKESLPGYDRLFKTDENKYALIVGVRSDEKVFLEIEKIRKSLSAKIYNIEDKEINFTVSFAIKRFDDLSMTRDEFLEELDDLLDLAKSEGGNIVKI